MNRLFGAAVGLALFGAVAAATANPAAAQTPQTGKNTITGKAPGGVCRSKVIYLYPVFPDISGADGSSKLPIFETPAPGSEHWEAPCANGGFAFAQIPDGSYVAGFPGPSADKQAFIAAATVQDGQSVEVELKPQDPAH